MEISQSSQLMGIDNPFDRVMLFQDRCGRIWALLTPKVDIFAWMAVKERTATESVLLRRNLISEIQLALCPFCPLHLEPHQLLFLHCHFSWPGCVDIDYGVVEY